MKNIPYNYKNKDIIMKRNIILIIFLFSLVVQGFLSKIHSQDFISKITLNAVMLPEDVRLNYIDLPQRLTDYINSYNWSRDQLPYTIELNITIYFEEIYRSYEDQLRGRFLVGTNTGIQYADKQWRFNYNKGDRIDHNNPEFSPFLGLIDYYLYIIIGDELDMAGEHLGTLFYKKAEDICNQGKFSRYPWWWDKRQERINYILSDEHKLFRTMMSFLNQALYEYERGNKIDALKYSLETIKILESIISIEKEKEFCTDFLNRNYRELNKLASIPGGEKIKESLINIDPEHKDYYIKNE